MSVFIYIFFKGGNSIVLTDIVPTAIVTSTNEARYGKFFVKPLRTGIARVIGNALRRVLLSSLPGASVYYVKIDNVLHEFSTIPGVKEDVTEIVLNLKNLRLKVFSEQSKTMYLSVKGIGLVTAADIESDSEIEILNPSMPIATLTERDASLSMEIAINTGTRYISCDKHEMEGYVDIIPVDSYYSPIEKVCYKIEPSENGADEETLIMEVWTNGSILPNESLSRASKILNDYLNHFIGLKAGLEKTHKTEPIEGRADKPPLDMRVEEINLSVRALNCLKRASVETLGELVLQKESELMSIRNFGRKSMNEVIDKLKELGLSLKPEDD